MTILTVYDLKTKTCFKQFKTGASQGSKEYTKTSDNAHKLQKDICGLFGIINNGHRIGVHINLFNDVSEKKVLF